MSTIYLVKVKLTQSNQRKMQTVLRLLTLEHCPSCRRLPTNPCGVRGPTTSAPVSKCHQGWQMETHEGLHWSEKAPWWALHGNLCATATSAEPGFQHTRLCPWDDPSPLSECLPEKPQCCRKFTASLPTSEDHPDLTFLEHFLKRAHHCESFLCPWEMYTISYNSGVPF